MKRVIITLLVLFLFAASTHSRLVVLVETPEGETFELAAQHISCADTRASIEASFGERVDCLNLCARGPHADGRYGLRIGITPPLACPGPAGVVPIPGTGEFEHRTVTFCADDDCTLILDYCDCIPPNLSVPPSEQWYSKPFTITAKARDNHNLSSIHAYEHASCDGPICTKNITVPIGTVCTQTGTGACAVYVNATDLWQNTAETIERYNVDLNPPIARHEWLEEGMYHKDAVRVRFTAYEETDDESGIGALSIHTVPGGGPCPPHGANYTRHDNPHELVYEDDGRGVSFCYYATDRATPANRGDIERTGIRYADTTPPVVSFRPTQGWYTENQLVYIECTDENSGCDAYGYAVTNDTCPDHAGTRQEPYRTQCEEGSVCTYRICAWARDRVGHETTAQSEVRIDRSPPVIEQVGVESGDGTITLHLTVSDDGSGLETCTIIADEETGCDIGGVLTQLSTTIPCAHPCSYSVIVEDRAGNQAVLEGAYP